MRNQSNATTEFQLREASDYSDSKESAQYLLTSFSSNGLINVDINGVIGPSDQDDVDWFKLELVGGASYEFELTGGGEPWNLNEGAIQVIAEDASYSKKHFGYYSNPSAIYPGVSTTIQKIKFTAPYTELYFIGIEGNSLHTPVHSVGDYRLQVTQNTKGVQSPLGYNFGTNSSELLVGSNFNEKIFGKKGNDTIYGRNGNDLLYGESGNDALLGESGNDSLYGGPGYDTLGGGSGNDYLDSADANDALNGGDGNDILNGGKGNDTIDGGKGTDRLDCSNNNNTVNLLIDTPQLTGDGVDKVVNIENVKGNGGNDSLYGNTGKNQLEGDSGNDYLYGDSGDDIIDGGQGVDTAGFSSKDNVIDLRNGSKQNTKDGKDKLISIENINAGGGSDKVIGDNANNQINGDGGNDELIGGKGNDTLFGGKGNDLLDGGLGKNNLKGQQGKDIFRVSKGNGYSIIMDFSNGSDKIHLASGSNGLSLRTEGKNALIYQGSDQLAEVTGAAGILELKGDYLV